MNEAPKSDPANATTLPPMVIAEEICCFIAKLCSTLRPHGLQHARLPFSPTSPGACSNSCPLSWWCHPTISSSVVPFSFCLQSFPASGSFPMSQLFASGGQSIGASVSVLPMHIQGWFPLGWTGLISLLSIPPCWRAKEMLEARWTSKQDWPPDS